MVARVDNGTGVKRLCVEGQNILARIALLRQDQIELLTAQIDEVLDNAKFNTWMQAVDVCLASVVPLTHKDLREHPYREWYDMDLSPQDAATEALVDGGFVDAEEDECD